MKKTQIFLVFILFFSMAEKALPLAVSSAFAQAGHVLQIKLRWKPVPGVAHYKIQMSRRFNFKTILEEAESREPEWIWKCDPDRVSQLGDRIFYRIASVDRSRREGKFSSPIVLDLSELSVSTDEIAVGERLEGKKNDGITRKSSPSQGSKGPVVVQGGASFNLGIGNFSQSSEDLDLKQVTVPANFLQQKVLISLDLLRPNTSSAPAHLRAPIPDFLHFDRWWSAQFEFRFAPYHKTQDPRPLDQPSISTYFLRFDVLHWTRWNSNWYFAEGLTLDRSFRWVKSGSESVDAQGAFSAGPTIQLIRLAPSSKWYAPAEWGGLFSAPVTGLFSGGQLGINASAWSEWRFLRISKHVLGGRLEGDFKFARWATPAGTNVLMWSTWFALVCHFGSKEQVFTFTKDNI